MGSNLSTASERAHTLVNKFLKEFYQNDTSAPYLNKEISRYLDSCRYGTDDVRPMLVKLGYGITKKRRGSAYVTHAMAAIHLLLLSAIPVDDIVDGLGNRKNLPANDVSKQTSLAYSLSTKLREDARLILLKKYKSSPSILEILEIISRFLQVQDASHTLEVHSHASMPFSKYTLDDYLFLIDHATARFVAESFVIGGLLGDADKPTVKNMRDFGIQLGRLCQIRDDYLDYVNSQLTGKKAFSDLYGKRKRFPLLSVFWFGTRIQKKEVSQILKKPALSDSDVYNVIEIMMDKTIKKQSLEVVERIEDQAVQKLKSLSRHNPSYDDVLEIVDLFAMKS